MRLDLTPEFFLRLLLCYSRANAVLLLKAILFTVVVPGAVAIYIPRLMFANAPEREFGLFRYAGIPLLVFGAAIYVWCVTDFAYAGRGTPAPIDPPKQLVVRGLYKYVRNPMYIGVGLVLLGEALWFQRTGMLGYTAIVAVVWHVFVVLYEEPVLERTFGESYRRYRDEVPRWLPRA
jgi:protein-S-isoprenylcysteine O-methyltransferase Ste14